MASKVDSQTKAKNKAKALDAYQALLASHGDRYAFEQLYRRWHARLLRFAMRQSGDVDLAQDILQDAALAMAKNIHRLKDPEHFSAWAYTILRRRAADHIKRRIKQRKLNEDIAAMPPPDMSDAGEDLALRNALVHLPKNDSLLLTMFYVDGLTGAELGAALGVPIGTIKSRLFKARQRLKHIYETQ
ncbi:RNA polymerase sigma factor [Litorimonas sp. RW-G-Af-16]|uniref:RNA polymerase sigma factor n=1 Tax=Litorimonas sp. RW-G-Af-16 TaxID=3241168 RepID=UPI00390C91F8